MRVVYCKPPRDADGDAFPEETDQRGKEFFE